MIVEGDGTADRSWDEVYALVAGALELPAGERDAFLRAAEVSAEVRTEAASLVAASAAEDSRPSLLDRGLPGLGALAAMLVDGAAPSPWMGRRLGAYVVERELGRGGMGLVLQARRADSLYERVVAIKVIQATLEREEFTRRFRRETRILARLQHPSVIALLDAGTTEEDQPFFVMEYVDGVPIHMYAERERLTVPQMLALLVTLCDALEHAHAQGVVHRDIKPGNVLVSARGELKLLDFGIARLAVAEVGGAEQTVTQFRAVTPTYASPEQIAGEAEVTARSDVYSVGVLLYVLLTGKPPYALTGLSTAEVERVLRTTQPALPSELQHGRRLGAQARAFDAVIGRAMEHDPERRYGTIAELKAELERLRRGEEPLASARRLYARRWWRAHRNRARWVAATAATAALVAGAALWVREEHRAARRGDALPARVSLAVVPVPGAEAPLNAAVAEALSTELGSGEQIRLVPAAVVSEAIRDLRIGTAAELDAHQRAALGQRLGVDYLLEERATAQPAGGRDALHLAARLDRVRGTQPAWEGAVDTTVAGLGAATQQMAVNTARMLPLAHRFSASPSLLPHGPEAVRLYSEGLQQMQALEPVRARTVLTQAAAAEPRSPLIHIALARCWEMLGYRQLAVEEAGAAVRLTAGLPARTERTVRAAADEIGRQWPAAVADYKTLREYDPDDVEYVLGLARSQLAANQGQDALATLQAAAQMPGLLGADPRIALLTAEVQESLGRHAEALRSADEVFAAARERSATQLMAQAQGARASALESLGRVDEGLAAARQAEDLYTRADDLRGRGAMLIATGNFLEDHAKYAEAKAAYTEARTLSLTVGDDERLAVAENDLGIIAMDLGDAEEARAQYTRAMEIFRRVQNLPRVAAELNNIGIVDKELGDVNAAVASYTASLNLLARLHDARQVARVHNNLGIVLLGQGRLREAEEHYKQAYAIYTGEGQAGRAVLPLQGLAHLAWLQGRLLEAHRMYQQAMESARRTSEPTYVATALRADAHVLHAAGDEAGAQKELAQCEEIRKANGEELALAEAKLSGVEFAFDDGTDATVGARLPELMPVFLAKKDVADQVEAELMWTKSLLQQRDLHAARQHFRSAEGLVRHARDASLAADLVPVRAWLLAAEGNTRGAEALLHRELTSARASGNVAKEMDLLLEEVQVLADGRSGRRQALAQRFSERATRAGFLRVAHALQSAPAS